MTDPTFESHKAMENFILESLDEITNLLKTLEHPHRIQILALMINESKTFGQLLEKTGLQKSALGNHLSILSDMNLLEKLDRGLYRLTTDGEGMIEHIAQGFLECKVREREKLERIQRLIGRYIINGDKTMSENELDVRIVKLDPMHIASFRATGKENDEPEIKAWKKISTWAEKRGLLNDTERYPIFGFNNPDPSPDREEYGYEYWISIDKEIQPEDDINVKEFKGGLYAVTTTRLIVEDDIMPAWKKLAKWVKSSKYEFGSHQWLEKHINPRAKPEDLILDLYCPIKEK